MSLLSSPSFCVCSFSGLLHKTNISKHDAIHLRCVKLSLVTYSFRCRKMANTVIRPPPPLPTSHPIPPKIKQNKKQNKKRTKTDYSTNRPPTPPLKKKKKISHHTNHHQIHAHTHSRTPPPPPTHTHTPHTHTTVPDWQELRKKKQRTSARLART